ncbi:chaperone-modulator protein CbpM [Burkholderiaceae bacterium]|jgi:chaperone modulatory protein CbpM
MTTHSTLLQGIVVEEDLHLTITEICQACSIEEEHIHAWVSEGVLEPQGATYTEWRFSGQSLRRAKIASRLVRDLELNTPGVALALDLLEEIEALRRQLQNQA